MVLICLVFICSCQVGGVYVRLFLKDPKFPLRNPKRFLEGLLDQYVTAAAATHHARGGSQVDPQLPLLLSAALVSLLRVQPLLADHVAHLGYVPKLVSAMANEGRIISSATSQNVLAKTGSHGGHGEPSNIWDVEDGDSSLFGNQTPQEQVRLSCLRVLHQLAASTACAEAMATPGMGSPQVISFFLSLSFVLFVLQSIMLSVTFHSITVHRGCCPSMCLFLPTRALVIMAVQYRVFHLDFVIFDSLMLLCIYYFMSRPNSLVF